MLVNVAISKVNKHGQRIGGDTAEIVERPLGGVTGIIVDGQGSGRSAKVISNSIVGKITNLISDGARDGAVARAVQDYLFAMKDGKVSATLTMISLALDTQSIIISRNSHCPVIVIDNEREIIFEEQVQPLGFYKFSKPLIKELPLKTGMTIMAYTDGLMSAGKKYNNPINDGDIINILKEKISTQNKADKILDLALQLDGQKPNDDITILVIETSEEESLIRKINATFPL
ncbi:SpoIIE family protein phosphatase [Anaerobranca gottschalkii]|uniref:Stage II sporulation protein E (SpoIIE) n=1 Tax=Anaerobranca gottschalkii DSM 13577 TaxID=1120990 RepID=A0A1I0CS70_9FIRM|nr:SpoIIE family protein phosphatase [Anaerobranca gottschalkii]SET22502.1 Stage II sporulation protein E (SpoIIE) [Anaerobranca gottschalkii DSM 13577]